MGISLIVNSNPQTWLHGNHWDCEEVTISTAGSSGEQDLGVAVASNKVRRIREMTIRHTGTSNTVITVLIKGGNTKLTIDIPAQTTRVWSSENGLEFSAGQTPAVRSSNVTGGNSFISARGVEA